MKTRNICLKCLKSEASCLCALVKPFASGPLLALLMHPKERRKRAGTSTGRITHLCIQNSYLFEGVVFEHEPRLQKLLSDPLLFPMVLYPGEQAVNLSIYSQHFATELKKLKRRPLVFVIDATWSCASTLWQANPWLKLLPHLCFTPQNKSAYRFKTQPHKDCLSTLEAVPPLLSVFNGINMFPTSPPQAHDNMLEVFHKMVEYQVGFSDRKQIQAAHPEDLVQNLVGQGKALL